MASLAGFGEKLFFGAAATRYLQAQGLEANVLESPDWTWDGKADKVRKQACTLLRRFLAATLLRCFAFLASC
jgi:hypothetical protein